MNCSGCGGTLRLEANRDHLVCDYCGKLHFPEPDADGVRDLGEAADCLCPVCKVNLAHAAINSIRVLHCRQCKGILVDGDVFQGVIALIRATQSAAETPPIPVDWKGLDRHIECPKCGKPFDTHLYGGPGNVIIDNCAPCEINWLDHGELKRIARATDVPSPSSRILPQETSEEEPAGTAGLQRVLDGLARASTLLFTRRN